MVRLRSHASLSRKPHLNRSLLLGSVAASSALSFSSALAAEPAAITQPTPGYLPHDREHILVKPATTQPPPPLPPIVLYPHATPVGQPVRTTGVQGRVSGHQYDWGVFNRGNGEAAGFGPVGEYGVAPWAEDWSRLRDKSKRKDPFDLIKYIPLNERGSIWLSFSGETRLRNWFESRPNLGTQHNNDSGRFAVRNLYGADLHLGSHVRLFGQLVNADAAGWNGYGYGSTYRKRLDAQQAFIETKWSLSLIHI